MLVGIGKEVTGMRSNRMKVKKCVHTTIIFLGSFHCPCQTQSRVDLIFLLLPWYQRMRQTLFFLLDCFSLFLSHQQCTFKFNSTFQPEFFSLTLFLFSTSSLCCFLIELKFFQNSWFPNKQRDYQFHYLTQQKKKSSVPYHVNARLLYKTNSLVVLISSNTFIKSRHKIHPHKNLHIYILALTSCILF